MSNTVVETLVGAIVLVVATGFLAFAYDRGQGGSTSGYLLDARFERVDGVSIGSDVRLSGIRIGSVVGQRIDPDTFQAVLTFSVADDILLPADTAVVITAEGLLGGNYLAIQPGGMEETLAPGDEVEETQDAVDLIGLFNKFIYGGDDQ